MPLRGQFVATAFGDEEEEMPTFTPEDQGHDPTKELAEANDKLEGLRKSLKNLRQVADDMAKAATIFSEKDDRLAELGTYVESGKKIAGDMQANLGSIDRSVKKMEKAQAEAQQEVIPLPMVAWAALAPHLPACLPGCRSSGADFIEAARTRGEPRRTPRPTSDACRHHRAAETDVDRCALLA